MPDIENRLLKTIVVGGVAMVLVTAAAFVVTAIFFVISAVVVISIAALTVFGAIKVVAGDRALSAKAEMPAVDIIAARTRKTKAVQKRA